MFNINMKGFTLLLMYLRAQAILPDEEWHRNGCMYGISADDLMAGYATHVQQYLMDASTDFPIEVHKSYCMNCSSTLSVESDVPQVFQTCPCCTGSYNTHELLTDVVRLNYLLIPRR